jgi:uncharacterized protein (TIGR03437 family)
MKLLTIPSYLLSLGFFSVYATAGVATFSTSAQTVTLTGIGANAQGEGVSSVVWGSCSYDGTNTECMVTAPYTGVGNGGTMTLLLTYPGKGPAPLTATSISPGSDFVNLGLTVGSFVWKLTDADGTSATFYQETNWMFQFSNPTCTGVTPCSVGQVGLTAGATITGPISGFFDATPVIATPQGVISASAYGGFSAVAPASWMEIYGYNLATVRSQIWGSADFHGNLAPSALGGTTVTIGGQPAFIDFVSPGQVNCQVPSNVATGSQPVVVTTAGGSSTGFMITVNTTEPGLLAPNAFHLAAGQYVAALFPDGTTFVLPPGAIPGIRSQRATPGQVITFYGVGFGLVSPNIPAGQVVSQSNSLMGKFAVSFGGVPATVTFSGLTGGYLGLYQFNVTVPNVAASDAVPLTFTVDGVAGAQTLFIAVGN